MQKDAALFTCIQCNKQTTPTIARNAQLTHFTNVTYLFTAHLKINISSASHKYKLTGMFW